VPPSNEFRIQLAAASADLERLVARLGRLSPLAWRTRREAIETLLRTLVAICERQQGRPLRAPDLEAHVLADAVAVIGREVVDTIGTEPDLEQVADLRAAVDAALAATR
jgi:hypothetical protein